MHNKINNATFLELKKSHTDPIVELANYPRLMSFSCAHIRIITTIKNIPDELYDLDCEGNIIGYLDGLGSNLNKLNCSHNNLTLLNNLPLD
jgi:hypothetical protein